MSGVVRLQLDLASFDETPFAGCVERCERAGIELSSMAALGDGEESRRRLYELNRECSADIPGRGPFFTFEEYVAARIARAAYLPGGTIVAREGEDWVGMAMVSDWRERGFLFNEMTGVRASHRRRGIALALKLVAIRFARSTGVRWLYTFHDPRSVEAIALNRRLGYVDAEWDESLLPRPPA